jgi:hypothetical protein
MRNPTAPGTEHIPTPFFPLPTTVEVPVIVAQSQFDGVFTVPVWILGSVGGRPRLGARLQTGAPWNDLTPRVGIPATVRLRNPTAAAQEGQP